MDPVDGLGDSENNVTIFQNAVREYIIFLLMFVLLYLLSYFAICSFKRRPESDESLNSQDQEDAIVYKITLWLCTFTLAISVGAVLLLPISILSNEILLSYPDSYYVKWLNVSLIHDLWNYIFFFANMSLFVLMPFAYFLTESEGLPGSRKGIWSRVYETVLLLMLLALVVVGLAAVASALLDNDPTSIESLTNLWHVHLPYLYSIISLTGVFLLLICTPVGFAWIFTVMGQLVMKPQFLYDLKEELTSVLLEEDCLKKKLSGNNMNTRAIPHDVTEIKLRLVEIEKERHDLERRRRAPAWRRNLGYPLALLLLLLLTAVSVIIIVFNTLGLVLGYVPLPYLIRHDTYTSLAKASLSTSGWLSAALEVVLIMYFMLASVIGLYNVPLLCRLEPHLHETSMTQIISNCIVLLVLSSALPVLSRTLGITNFDLLGDFGKLDWLGNIRIVVVYNLLFAASTAYCLFKKFTAAVPREIYLRFLAYRRTWGGKPSLLWPPNNCTPPGLTSPSPRPSRTGLARRRSPFSQILNIINPR